MLTIIYVVIPARSQPNFIADHGLIRCASTQEAQQLAQDVGGRVLVSQIFPN